MKVFIFNYTKYFLEINVKPNETFQETFRALLGEKKYGTAGSFIWNKVNPDDTISKIRLLGNQSPSSVPMDIDRPQILEWKQARVWRMLTK